MLPNSSSYQCCCDVSHSHNPIQVGLCAQSVMVSKDSTVKIMIRHLAAHSQSVTWLRLAKDLKPPGPSGFLLVSSFKFQFAVTKFQILKR